MQQGYITWTYWLSSARLVDLARYQEPDRTAKKSKEGGDESSSTGSQPGVADEEPGSIGKAQQAKARITVHASGLEWFVYNRTPVYDSILAEGLNHQDSYQNATSAKSTALGGLPAGVTGLGPRSVGSFRPPGTASVKSAASLPAIEEKNTLEATSDSVMRPSSTSTQTSEESEEGPCFSAFYSLMLRFLPIYIDCEKGAVSLGNETTRALVITTFARARGHVDATGCGPLDIFRQLFDFEIDHPVVQMRPNADYKHSQQTAAEGIIFGTEALPKENWLASLRSQIIHFSHGILRNVRRLLPRFGRSTGSINTYSEHDSRAPSLSAWDNVENADWHGLNRYLDEEELNEHEGWTHIDYARFLTLLDCPSINFCFYWDLPGQVVPQGRLAEPQKCQHDINQAEPPAYGMRISIKGGTVNYGPWTDRLRAEIQDAFLPNPFRSVTPAPTLAPGSSRQSTRMLIEIEIEDEVTLRVPTKESSKDWQWKGRIQALRQAEKNRKERTRKHFLFKRDTQPDIGQDIRPFGWFSFSVAADSTVKYEMDPLPGPTGYRNDLEMDLKETKARSSVNHGLLWRCEAQQLKCDLSNPLGWNSLRSWTFDIKNRSMELFLLRDHMFLLIDLIDDFTAGAKPGYLTFVPFRYDIGLDFTDLKLYLNSNDANIIDNPTDLDENTFLILGFAELQGSVGIPMINLNPSQNSVLFKGTGRSAYMDLSAPLSNTLNTFVSKDSIATLKGFSLDGSYNYCASISPQCSDSLVLDIEGTGLTLFLHGFLIRYFSNMKENYFGEDMHFRTLEEYQTMITADTPADAGHPAPAKKENDLDTILTVRANRCCALMPINLYSRKQNIRYDVLLGEADMRFTNYYMDLDVNTSPVEVSLETFGKEDPATIDSASNCQIFVDGATVVGHRFFGAPPTEPAYVSHWDIQVGDILGELSAPFMQSLTLAIKSFIFTLDDDENALPAFRPDVSADASFVKVHTGMVQLWLTMEDAAVMLKLPSAAVLLDDWAGSHFSKQLLVSAPDVTVAAVDAKSATRHHEDSNHKAKTFAYIRTAIEMRMFNKKPEFHRARALQQHHIRYHDRRTHRADWLLHDTRRNGAAMKQADWAAQPPSLPMPTFPEPITSSQSMLPGRARLRGLTTTRRLRRPQSFLSLSSSTASARQDQARRKPKRAGGLPTMTNDRNQDGTSSNHGVAGSSQWTPPYFPLLNVEPDLSEVPRLPKSSHSKHAPGRKRGDTQSSEPSSLEEQKANSHTGFVCNIPRGIVGFCTPELFSNIAAFVEKTQPQHPIDILDEIQIDAVKKTLKRAHMSTTPGQVIDFSLSVPNACFRLLDWHHDQQDVKAEHQYDVVMDQTRVTGRVVNNAGAEPAESAQTAPKTLIHATNNTLSITAAERSVASRDIMSSAQIGLSDLTFWLGRHEMVRSRLHLRGIDLGVTGSRVSELASLIQSTGTMVESIVHYFDALRDEGLSQYLVHYLISAETDVVDPTFLTRPSYALRVADRHLRQDDSWKVISRLRNNYQSLDTSAQEMLIEKIAKHQFALEADCESQVISKMEHWRSLDHDVVERPAIVDVLFGPSRSEKEKMRTSDPFQIEASIGHTRVSLDTGKSQSVVLIADFGLSVSSKTRKLDRRSTFLQQIRIYSYVSQLQISLEWDLINLLGDVFEQFDSQPESSTSLSPDTAVHRPAKIDLFVVVATDQAMIRVRSLNTSLRLASQNMSTSVGFLQQYSGHDSLNLIFASSSASAKIRTQSSTLMGWRIDAPNTYVSQVSHSAALGSANDLRVGATCEQLRFDMKKDVLGILDTVKVILRDEVPVVQQLVVQANRLSPRGSQPTAGQSANRTEAHVALLLKDYRLKFSLLPSFAYVVAGNVARMSIVPQWSSKIAVNFDLKDNRHFLRSDDNRTRHAPPALEIPPINGAVFVTPRDNSTQLEIRTAVEQIDFEAAAVRAFIDAVNRSDFARMIVRMKSSIDEIKATVERLSPIPAASASTIVKTPGTPVAFTSYMTIAGLNIHCSAPAIKDQRYETDVDLMIGFTSLCVHNRTHDENIVHETPQFEGNLQQLAIGIRRTTSRRSVRYGSLALNLRASGRTERTNDGGHVQAYNAETRGIEVDLYPETAMLVIDIVAFFQEKLKSFTLIEEARNFPPLRRFTVANLEEDIKRSTASKPAADDDQSMDLFKNTLLSLEINAVRIRWLLDESGTISRHRELEDLVFSIQKIDFKKKAEASARLAITNLQLQMVPKSQARSIRESFDASSRSSNSALLPEVVFNAAYLSTKKDRRLAFQAAGKALDLRLSSDFILPASAIQKSLARAAEDVRDANKFWTSGVNPEQQSATRTATSLLGNKRLASLLLDADFAGAIVAITPRTEQKKSSAFSMLKGNQRSRAGRYGQVVQGEAAKDATLRSPGVALKVHYHHDGESDPNLSAHLRVAASSNVLYPSVVPLILEISSSIKEQVGDDESSMQATTEEKNQLSGYLPANSDPHAILGNCKLNAGLWIQKQEFTLSCQPIAQVAATAKFDDIFLTINTVQGSEQDRFFALVSTFDKLNTSVQHVYSRESTASFEVDSIVISAMNSKQVSSKPGISAIINVSPMKSDINVKQLQDFLLFREIWYPPELRQPSKPPSVNPISADAHVQRYQQAANGAFLWNAVVSIQELKLSVDLGQGIGTSVFVIESLWASSKKSSDIEQNLCIGFDKVGIESTGRMSGFVELQNFRLRTSIAWPRTAASSKKAPLIQAAIGFSHFRTKAAFDYQPFAVADISSFDFLMYNVRQGEDEQDRLVATLEGDKVQVFCISTTAALVFALFQAFERLVQEKQEAYQASIAELDRYLRRKSVFPSATYTARSVDPKNDEKDVEKVPFSLHTDVVVTLQAVSMGVFPATFFDNQILKAEATDAQARFAVSTRNNQTHSGLGMTLGQLRVALSGVSRANTQALGEVAISDVVQRATSSRGGTILKVPKLVMAMSTWQTVGSNTIEYIFKSVFEGKVDVGWNYSRISFIRGMWNAHSRALAQRLGKPLTQSAVKITTEPKPEGAAGGQERITAVVNMPQSKFDYVARVPPIIDTPQLRDLGEATPSVELFGKS